MFKIFVVIGIFVLAIGPIQAQSLYNSSGSDNLELEASADINGNELNTIENHYEIYPNPISAFFELTTGHNELVKIKIKNSIGQQMHESVIRDRALINCSTWKKGTYTLELYRDNEMESKEFKITF